MTGPREGDKVLYHGSQIDAYGTYRCDGPCGCRRCKGRTDRVELSGCHGGFYSELGHVRPASVTVVQRAVTS